VPDPDFFESAAILELRGDPRSLEAVAAELVHAASRESSTLVFADAFHAIMLAFIAATTLVPLLRQIMPVKPSDARSAAACCQCDQALTSTALAPTRRVAGLERPVATASPVFSNPEIADGVPGLLAETALSDRAASAENQCGGTTARSIGVP
jgi:hypothetical protein